MEPEGGSNERLSPRTHLPLKIAQHVVGDFKDDRPLASRDCFDDVAAVAGEVEERAALPFAERLLDLLLQRAEVVLNTLWGCGGDDVGDVGDDCDVSQ